MRTPDLRRLARPLRVLRAARPPLRLSSPQHRLLLVLALALLLTGVGLGTVPVPGCGVPVAAVTRHQPGYSSTEAPEEDLAQVASDAQAVRDAEEAVTAQEAVVAEARAASEAASSAASQAGTVESQDTLDLELAVSSAETDVELADLHVDSAESSLASSKEIWGDDEAGKEFVQADEEQLESAKAEAAEARDDLADAKDALADAQGGNAAAEAEAEAARGKAEAAQAAVDAKTEAAEAALSDLRSLASSARTAKADHEREHEAAVASHLKVEHLLRAATTARVAEVQRCRELGTWRLGPAGLMLLLALVWTWVLPRRLRGSDPR